MKERCLTRSNPVMTHLPAAGLNSAASAGEAAGRQPPKLLERFSQLLLQRQVPDPVIGAYADWVARYIRFHGLRHPRELGSAHVAQFLERADTAPQQRAQAARALQFLYDE